jgi:hypothetical protein
MPAEIAYPKFDVRGVDDVAGEDVAPAGGAHHARRIPEHRGAVDRAGDVGLAEGDRARTDRDLEELAARGADVLGAVQVEHVRAHGHRRRQQREEDDERDPVHHW